MEQLLQERPTEQNCKIASEERGIVVNECIFRHLFCNAIPMIVTAVIIPTMPRVDGRWNAGEHSPSGASDVSTS